MSRCAKDNAQVVYAVVDETEKILVYSEVHEMGISTTFKPGGPSCILTHGELYSLAKSPNCGGLTTKGVIVFCEVDIHYSLEYTLAMVCFMQGAAATGWVQVLIVSHHSHDPEDSLIKACDLIVPARRDFKLFDLSAESPEHNNFDHNNLESDRVDHEASLEIADCLARGMDVLVFCQESEAIFQTRQLEETDIKHRSLVLGMARVELLRVLASRSTSGDDMLENPPTVLFVPGTGRIPIQLKSLGLVVVGGWRTGKIFNHQSGYTVNLAPQRSYEEIIEAIGHKFVTRASPEVRLLVHFPAGANVHPPQRIKNDQMMAFLFEAMQVCVSIDCVPIIHCFIPTDTGLVREMFRRLTVGGWAKLVRRQPSPILPAAAKLSAILPILDYDFEPAAFLAGFDHEKDSDATRRAAVRMAVFFHNQQRLDQLYLQPRGGNEEGEGQGEGNGEENRTRERRISEAARKFVRRFFKLPADLAPYSYIWLALGLWHTGACCTHNYTTISPFDEYTYGLDLLKGTPLENKHFINALSFQAMVPMVKQLERTMQVTKPMSRKPISLKPEDCGRIQYAMLNAWMYRTVNVKIHRRNGRLIREVSDMVSWRSEGVRLLDREFFRQLRDCEETPWLGTVVVALDTDKGTIQSVPPRPVWMMQRIFIIPRSVILRWVEDTSQDFEHSARSGYIKN